MQALQSAFGTISSFFTTDPEVYKQQEKARLEKELLESRRDLSALGACIAIISTTSEEEPSKREERLSRMRATTDSLRERIRRDTEALNELDQKKKDR